VDYGEGCFQPLFTRRGFLFLILREGLERPFSVGLIKTWLSHAPPVVGVSNPESL